MVFEGEVILEDGVIIGSNCILKNCTIGKNSQVHPFSLIEDSIVGSIVLSVHMVVFDLEQLLEIMCKLVTL